MHTLAPRPDLEAIIGIARAGRPINGLYIWPGLQMQDMIGVRKALLDILHKHPRRAVTLKITEKGRRVLRDAVLTWLETSFASLPADDKEAVSLEVIREPPPYPAAAH
jgi:hypothetical protein